MKGKGRVLGAVLMALLLSAGTECAMADDSFLPPSALLVRQQQVMTDDSIFEVPEFVYNELNTAQMDELNETIRNYAGKETSLLINDADTFYFYEQLPPLQKEIYDLLYLVAEDPVSEGNIQLMRTTEDPGTDEFQLAFCQAYYSLVYDHPELFWIYPAAGEATLTYAWYPRMLNGRYMVYFSMKEPFDAFEEQMTAFNQAASSFLADIDRTASQYEIIKQIHDKLMDLVVYDVPCCERHGPDLAHTAYGVLVENTEGTPNYAVCDGYSLAFEYILQQCNIPATVVMGYGGSSPLELGGHAWSIVQLDGEWYEVDSTWDDNNIDEEFNEPFYDPASFALVKEFINDPVFREKLGHYLFLISSEVMGHYIAPAETNWEYYFSDGSGPINLAPSDCYHVREDEYASANLGDDNPISDLMLLVPHASQSYQQ